jgi:hypothetical protein
MESKALALDEDKKPKKKTSKFHLRLSAKESKALALDEDKKPKKKPQSSL